MKKALIFLSIVMLATAAFSEGQDIGLSIGDMAPEINEKMHNGDMFTLSENFNDGPIVLLFYRGGWCVYCNIQLQEYQKNLDRFEALGAMIVAVSVDLEENAAVTVQEKELGFNVVSNPNANVLEDYKVVYRLPDSLAKTYKEKYNIDLEAASGRKDHLIAVPATYILDSDGKIIFASANEDYKVRVSADEVIEFISSHGSKAQ